MRGQSRLALPPAISPAGGARTRPCVGSSEVSLSTLKRILQQTLKRKNGTKKPLTALKRILQQNSLSLLDTTLGKNLTKTTLLTANTQKKKTIACLSSPSGGVHHPAGPPARQHDALGSTQGPRHRRDLLLLRRRIFVRLPLPAPARPTGG